MNIFFLAIGIIYGISAILWYIAAIIAQSWIFIFFAILSVICIIVDAIAHYYYKYIL